jgi:hypothetical protein
MALSSSNPLFETAESEKIARNRQSAVLNNTDLFIVHLEITKRAEKATSATPVYEKEIER